MRLDCKIEISSKQTKVDCFNAYGFCGFCNEVFEAMSIFHQYGRCEEAEAALTEKKTFNVDRKRWKWMKCSNSISRKKDTLLSKCLNVNGGTLHEWSIGKGTLEKIISSHDSIAPWSVLGEVKIRRIVWLPTLWYQFSWASEKTVCQFPSNLQK